jgi:hypothetical protein
MSWLAASVLLLSGCNVVIQNPANQSTVAVPAVAVRIVLPGLYRAGTFNARLNEADITSQFTVNAQSGTASAGLTLTPGSYVLDIAACWGPIIYFVVAPPWPVNGCSGARASFTVVQPRLVLDPPGLSIAVGQTTTPTIQAIPGPSGALTIALSVSPASTLGAPNSVTVPANSTAPVNISPVEGVGPGVATISASAPGYTAASLNVRVVPFLTALSPPSGLPGTVVAITGGGFLAPLLVQFGAAPITVTPASSTQLSVTVPQPFPPGFAAVTVTSKGQTSAALGFTVTSTPPPTCGSGTTLCNGKCVNLSNDPKNCGSCGATCPASSPKCCGGPGCWFSFGQAPFCYSAPL